MSGPEVTDDRVSFSGLVFDLSRLTVNDIKARVRSAIALGLSISVAKQNLRRMLDSLRAESTNDSVRLFNDQQSWLPGSLPLANPAAALWTDVTTGKLIGFDGAPQTRRMLRIWISPVGDTYAGLIETTWHELLHTVSPFTHRQGGMPEKYVDQAAWSAAITAIHRDFPASAIDPVTKERQDLTFTWSALSPSCPCIGGPMLASAGQRGTAEAAAL